MTDQQDDAERVAREWLGAFPDHPSVASLAALIREQRAQEAIRWATGTCSAHQIPERSCKVCSWPTYADVEQARAEGFEECREMAARLVEDESAKWHKWEQEQKVENPTRSVVTGMLVPHIRALVLPKKEGE